MSELFSEQHVFHCECGCCLFELLAIGLAVCQECRNSFDIESIYARVDPETGEPIGNS